MALFNRDYDRNFGFRGSDRGGYDQGFRRRGGTMGDFGRERVGTRDRGGMDRSWTGAGRGYDLGYGGRTGSRYDQPYWGYDTWRYDREYKSRAQTDYGDPFGDREQNTPIRVVEDPHRDRGWFGWGSDYDREQRGRGRESGRYDRPYGRNPVGYDPYDTRGGDVHRLRGRARSYDRGYGSEWF